MEQRWGVQGQGREMRLPQPPRGEGNILRVLSRESDLPSLCPGSVLPNFEVKIIPENPYILTTPGFLSDIQVIIQARYLPLTHGPHAGPDPRTPCAA